jgi:hypothetical protein
VAALNFVAIEDGLEEDPKLLGLGKLLGVPRQIAVWYVFRLRRLILRSGDHLHGSLPRNVTVDDIASFLDFKGSSRRLVDALKSQGYLGFRKGRGFYCPGWRETTTGHYAWRREEDRLWHERRRLLKRASPERLSLDVVRQPGDTSSDRVTTSERIRTESNESSGAERPPDPPPVGGDSLADARWKWLEEHAPTPQNRDACKRILGPMSEQDWALVQRSYGLLRGPGTSISKRNRRPLYWPTIRFLREQAYLRFGGIGRPARTPPKPRPSPPRGESFDAVGEDLARRLVGADAFVTDMLRDPELSEEKKAEARERWLANPENAGRVPPWIAP